MKVLVINCTDRRVHYNLGARKLRDWLKSDGHVVTYCDGDPGPLLTLGYDLVCLSVIFSWHAPIARDIALRVKGFADVWCGGPGMTRLVEWWRTQTGLTCSPGIDARFERQRGDYRMTFASRGCPVGCWFCVVPQLEGRAFTLYYDFTPAPILCDNNLSALPVEFQEHIIRRYAETGVTLVDANSGFEPAAFDGGTFERWSGIVPLWRFAFDEAKEAADVQRVATILRNVSPRRKQVYVLAGNEPIAICHERAQKVLEWGCEPYCQFVKPLNYLGGDVPVRFDWTPGLARDFVRYYNRRLWRAIPIHEYSDRQGEDPPFAFLRRTA